MKLTFLYLLIIALMSCSSAISDRSRISVSEGRIAEGVERFPVGARVAVLPFENFTETPLAGHRVASIVEGVAASKGYSLVKNDTFYQVKEYTEKDIMEILKTIKDVDFVITGKVNEFRYKAGIDGEPAVSITLLIYSVREGRPVYVATKSKTGWYFQSVTTVAQKIIRDLLPDGSPR